jgi:hypothetical protein
MSAQQEQPQLWTEAHASWLRGEPLKWTTAQWRNATRRRRNPTAHNPGDHLYDNHPVKELCHSGPLEQFAYGTYTPSDWRPRGGFQRCIICTPVSGVIADDVDDPEAYAGTRTVQFIRFEHRISERGDHWHALIDCRPVPPSDWPVQGPIAGGDIKSNGWIPVPGCGHHSGMQYEPAWHPGRKLLIVTATPPMMAAINADLEDEKQRRQPERSAQARGNGGGGGGNGRPGGHDGWVAGQLMSIMLRGGPQMTKEQARQEWLKIAIPQDPSWDYDPETDFERHYGNEHRGALMKVRKRWAAEEQAHQMYCQWLTGVTR